MKNLWSIRNHLCFILTSIPMKNLWLICDYLCFIHNINSHEKFVANL